MPSKHRPSRPGSTRSLHRGLFFTACALSFLVASSVPAWSQQPPPELDAAIRGHVQALESLSGDSPDSHAALRERFASELSDSLDDAALTSLAEQIGDAVRRAGMIRVALDEGGLVRLELREGNDLDVVFGVAPQPPHAMTSLEVRTDVEDSGPEPTELSWTDLEAQLEAAASEGFVGTVLAQNDGRTVLHRTFGLGAARDARTDLVYDIGSMPIDFTVAAILHLAEQGKLGLDDPVVKHLGPLASEVPADKRSMTIRHLMTGQSGLPNFHDRPGDADPDLTWIDRDTAMRRILEQELLFAPGSGQAHSHSAFGLLAAVVEIVSGVPYGAYLESHIFGPAGMERTGFYGDDLGLGNDAFVAGQGPNQAADPNIPPLWGPTSWLVMGSGGMESTTGDMLRFYDAMAAGKVLEGDAAQRYREATLGIGGTDRGFLFLHASNGRGDRVLLATPHESPLVASLVEGVRVLVLGD